MKKLFLPLVIVTATLFAACSGNSNSNNALKESNDSLRAVIAERDASLEEVLQCIRVVEEGFQKINEAQGRINSTGLEAEGSRKERLQNDVLYLTQLIEKNNTEVARLKKLLASSKNVSKELRAIVANLEKTLQEKNEEIASLHKQLEEQNIHIAKLDTIITNLTDENTQQELRLVEKERELNSVWYVFGTKKELKNEKIISGSEVMTDPDANKDYFTRSDKNQLTEINTYSRKAKVLSTHPEGSYKIVEDSEGNIARRVLERDTLPCDTGTLTAPAERKKDKTHIQCDNTRACSLTSTTQYTTLRPPRASRSRRATTCCTMSAISTHSSSTWKYMSHTISNCGAYTARGR